MIVFRTSCGAREGWGHLVRSTAIADEVAAAGGRACFLVAGDSGQARRLIGDRHPVHHAPDGPVAPTVVELARSLSARAVLLDGYGFTDVDEAEISDAGLAVAAMDDFGHNPHRAAALVVNGNLHFARASLYPEALHARLLLGPEFAPLRPELRKARIAARDASAPVRRIIVVMGGSDAGGVLDDILGALLGELSADIALVAAGRPRGDTESRLRRVEAPDELAREMARADLGISAGGMTSYEFAFLGVPAVIVPATDVQSPVSEELERRGSAVVVRTDRPPGGDVIAAVRDLLQDPVRRQAMADAGQAMFDGLGAARIAAALLDLERQL